MKKEFLLVLLCAAVAVRGGVREQFANPPPDSKLQAWYHWTTTGITDACLAADLKAMGELGIGTAHVFMPGQQGLPPNTEPLTPEWWKRWETTLREAAKNGVRIGFHNCPGWSSSGGTWIRPEDSMKVLVASETDVERLTGVIPLNAPRKSHGFYRDVAVYALPIGRPAVPVKVSGDFQADYEVFRAGKAPLVLPTARGEKGCELVFEFATPFAPTSLVTSWEESQFYLDVSVFASDDAHTWLPVGSYAYRLYNAQLTPKVMALKKMSPHRFFKVAVSTVQPPVWVGYVRRKLAAVTFSTLPYVIDVDGKNGAACTIGYRPAADGAPAGFTPSSVADLTAYLRADGSLDLRNHKPGTSLPAGRMYRLLRVGYTTTGKCCAPAPGNVRGLECDKLSKKGLDAHWPNMPEKMIMAPGGAGTVADAIIDSYEVGGQNWTESFPEEFQKRRGYAIRPWLPAMVGYTVGTAEETAKFLFDVQRTVSDLFAENYYDYFAEKCHALGIKSVTESYGGPFDSMRCFAAADVPTGEFWLGRSIHGSPRVAASAGHLHGRAQVGAESFTTEAKEGRWQITPHQFRVEGDRGWLEGISQLVYHSYLQQPFMNVQPGFSLDRHGTQFNRNTTWWPEGKWWAKYVQRGQFILQSGEPQADMLILSGDSRPNDYAYPQGVVDAGYNFDFCGAADFRQLEAKAGGVAMPGRLPYAVLWLGYDRYLTVATLRQIRKLLQGGAKIAGQRPIDTPTLGDDRAMWRALVAEIWDKPHANLKEAANAEKALKAFGCRPPADSQGALIALHRVIEGRDFYFVMNPETAYFDGAVSFVGQGRPERWDAKTGTITPLPWYADEAGRVKTRLVLEGEESAFVSFRAPKPGEAPHAMWDGPVMEWAPVEILSARYEARDDAKLGIDVTAKVRSLVASGNLSFVLGNAILNVRDPASNHYKVLRVDWRVNGEARHSDFAEHAVLSFRVKKAHARAQAPVLADLSRDWRIVSFKGRNPPTAPRTCETLTSWSASSDETLRYFAGRAVYEKSLSPELFAACGTAGDVVLDLGDVREIANVSLDDRFLACVWEAPYRLRVPLAALRAARVLKVEVINTWPNRLIGDAKARAAGAAEPRGAYGLPQWVLADKPDSGTGIYTWMNWMKGWTAADEPRPAGLLGPVRVLGDATTR